MSIESVVKNGFCIGCGGCQYSSDGEIEIKFVDGFYKASIEGASKSVLREASSICPFSDDSLTENQLADRSFLSNALNYSEDIGYYNELYAGKVADDVERENSSSGGMTTWILERLLDLGEVDRVIHVSESENGMFQYKVSSTIEELRTGKKSKYYPVTMGGILGEIDSKLNYAITGVPCFIKTIRSLQYNNQLKNVKYCVALFCGHLKYSYFSEMLGWELGVNPKKLNNFNFRKKVIGYNSSDYFVEAIGESTSKQGRVSEQFGTNWAHGFFKPQACEFCDDICGELSDITLGDAWLPEYTEDWLGTNIVISRNSVIDSILKTGIESKAIRLDSLSENKVLKSQDANYRHRRGGIVFRTKYLGEDAWVPKKRVELCGKYYDSSKDSIWEERWKLSKDSIRLFRLAKKYNVYILFKIPMYAKVIRYNAKVCGPLNALTGEARQIFLKIYRKSGLRKLIKGQQ
ncbi:hypothetical protein HJ093_13695 [Vibrio parahaemolyticus]|nr:Coenzyme F420 hydrogenase/dehydrogenase, beta subunit C-terminal domain [Vibrio parahaemolyticus]EIU7851288.1 Coenzyme F420 hydrogenase/dehydrogenase, beta subunit C-terminal domain [Vibrio parahaemolyticus]EIY7830984.1 Coenzyme F420 hydrogenase/dehydrogenase, beta subunit C-terminal domain [Vibrio parahaemolyticus]MBE4194326.1 hypothetical protein [Vibrio parahaemolyticus]MBO0151995.1 Coenzyme F420 hydrogenase/dehydrogenase, beta subunit C-terminal domain [Vibrio parahaemolyticus]MDF547692